MNEIVQAMLDIVTGLWRRRLLISGVAWLTFLVGTAVVMSMPDIYQATAKVYVDTESQLRKLLDDKIVESDLDERIRLVREKMLGFNQLQQVALNAGLITEQTGELEQRAVIAALNGSIAIIGTQDRVRQRDQRSDDVYTISMQHTNRETAISIVSQVLSVFVEGTIEGNRSSSDAAGRFLQSQIDEYETRLREAEEALADFNREHFDRLPGMQGGYFERLQAASVEYEETQQLLNRARSRLRSVESQLTGDLPMLETSSQPNSIQARVLDNERQLDELRLRFTDDHPDVIAQLELVESLRRRLQEQTDSIASGNRVLISDNPVVQALQISRNDLQAQVSELGAQLIAREQRVQQLRNSIDEIPEVEAEFARLNRDYEVISQQHRALLDSLERENLTRGVIEMEQVEFQIVSRPSAAFEPIAPRRTIMSVLVLLGSIGCGVAVAYAHDQLRPVFRSISMLQQRLELPVLGSVQVVQTGANKSGLSGKDIVFYLASFALILAGAAVIVLQLLGMGLRF